MWYIVIYVIYFIPISDVDERNIVRACQTKARECKVLYNIQMVLVNIIKQKTNVWIETVSITENMSFIFSQNSAKTPI